MAALPVESPDSPLEGHSNGVSSAEHGASLVRHATETQRGHRQAQGGDAQVPTQPQAPAQRNASNLTTEQLPNSSQFSCNSSPMQQPRQPRQSPPPSRPLGDTAAGCRHDQGTRTVATKPDSQTSPSMQTRAACVGAQPPHLANPTRATHATALPPSVGAPRSATIPPPQPTSTHAGDVSEARPSPFAPGAAGLATVDRTGAHVAAGLSASGLGGGGAAETPAGWNTPHASLTSLPGADSFNSIPDSDGLPSPAPLPVPATHSCPFRATLPCSVGSRPNCRHGSGVEASHPFEDRTVCEINSADRADRVQLVVGLFDGHDGARCVDFVSKPLVAGMAQAITRCIGSSTTILENAREAICEQHFRSWDDRFLREMCQPAQRQREQLLGTLPQGLNSWQLYQQYPAAADTLGQLAEQLTGGCTGSVAFVVDEKLTVANVGDSRVLLCELQADSVRACKQLSQDHDVNNPDEQKRLASLSLDVDSFVKAGRLGPVENTRSFGDFSVKTGWQDVDVLSTAVAEPVVAVPHIAHADLPDQWLLLLMSDGVYKAIDELAEARFMMSEQPVWLPRSGEVDANRVVAQLVCDTAAQVGSSRLQAVAESVLESISRWHQMAWSAAQALGERSTCRKLDDLSLACFWAA
eukprot:m.25129 g.25129  ORF g.25129 m.25129 type:complete len:639 (+) comp7758_c0_seq1:88-2004(+)